MINSNKLFKVLINIVEIKKNPVTFKTDDGSEPESWGALFGLKSYNILTLQHFV